MVITMLLILIFTAGCGNDNSNDYEPYEPIVNNGGVNNNDEPNREPSLEPNRQPETNIAPGEINITFENVSADERAALTNVHEIDFLEKFLHAMSAGSDYDVSTWEESLAWLTDRRDSGILISTNTPIRNFKIFGITNDFNEQTEQISLHAEEIFYQLDELLPNQPLFLNMFFTTGGVFPCRGISFTAPNGTIHSYALAENRIDDSPPFFLQGFLDGE